MIYKVSLHGFVSVGKLARNLRVGVKLAAHILLYTNVRLLPVPIVLFLKTN